jgi:hypothetical protein
MSNKNFGGKLHQLWHVNVHFSNIMKASFGKIIAWLPYNYDYICVYKILALMTNSKSCKLLGNDMQTNQRQWTNQISIKWNAHSFLVPCQLCQRGLLVYPQSVLRSVIMLPVLKIFNWYLICERYRSSLSFVLLDLFLSELFPLMITVNFPDNLSTRWRSSIGIFLGSFVLGSCKLT